MKTQLKICIAMFLTVFLVCFLTAPLTNVFFKMWYRLNYPVPHNVWFFVTNGLVTSLPFMAALPFLIAIVRLFRKFPKVKDESNYSRV